MRPGEASLLARMTMQIGPGPRLGVEVFTAAARAYPAMLEDSIVQSGAPPVVHAVNTIPGQLIVCDKQVCYPLKRS